MANDKEKRGGGQRNRDASSRRRREETRSTQDIGAIPPVADWPRRLACRLDLPLFIRTYLGFSFPKPFSPDHLRSLGKAQQAVLYSGLFAQAAPRGDGKALALDTLLPTPTGWTTMGEVAIGDELFDERGEVCRVVFATEIQHDRECYAVTFDDGEIIRCCKDHLWTVQDRYSNKPSLTLKTEQMAGRVVLSTKRGWIERRYSIPLCEPINPGNETDFYVSPYILGAWLGDGRTDNNSITIGDKDLDGMRALISRHEVLGENGDRCDGANAATYQIGNGLSHISGPDRVKQGITAKQLLADGKSIKHAAEKTGLSLKTVAGIVYGDTCSISSNAEVSLRGRLTWLGVRNNKHIPPQYLRASIEDRLELLRGLMDTDGTINKNGTEAEYCTKLPVLRDDVMELLASLGYKPFWSTKVIDGREYYRITFAPTNGVRVFGLQRKADRQKRLAVRISATRRIVSIEKIQSVPVKCIQVDSPSHLFLCGRGMIPTHNTERTKATSLWATLYGHRKFVLMIGATSGAADELLDGIRFYLDGAATIRRDEDGAITGFDPGYFPLLLADFPEILFPILALEGEAKRQGGQRCGGKKTNIHWGGKWITFPTVPHGNWIDGKTIGPAPGAGSTLRTTGITGRIRGFNINGLRPDLVLPDDPQTDESAASPAGNAKIERILAGAVIGLAGPGKKIAGIMPCTVIRREDAIDNILSHAKHPEWDSSRTKMLYAFPKRLEADAKNPDEPSWETYRNTKNNYDPFGADGDKRRASEEATLYYLENHEKLSEGAEVAWAERFAEDELDALQHAMNLFYQDRAAFFAEYQNEPEEEAAGNVVELKSDDVVAKLSGVPRGVVPFEATRLTAFIDVQGTLLYWLVAAWRDDFTGYVVDYRAWPDQKRPYFTLDQASPTLAKATGVAGDEAQIKVGLTSLVAELLDREWPREKGGGTRIDRLIIDSGHQAEVIYHFCRTSSYGALVVPSKGIGVGAGTRRGIAEGKLNPGDLRGLDWILPAAKESRGVRLLLYDTNAWKSAAHARLGTVAGLPGSLTLPGKDPAAHRLLADHLTAEYRDRKTSERTGRTVDEWSLRPGRPDNHWLDCLVGCAVAASMLGVTLEGVHRAAKPRTPVKHVSFAEMQKKAREAKR